MAAALGISSASLQNRVYEVKGQVVPTEMALAMQALSGTTYFADAIARRSGGVYVGLPALGDECDNDELLTKFTQIVDQLGVLARTHAQAIADGKVDAREKAELEQIARETYRHIQALLQLTFMLYQAPEGYEESGRDGARKRA